MNTSYIPHELIKETLQSKAILGNGPVEPLASLAIKNDLPFKIIEDKKSKNMPELHVKTGDLFCCLEGVVRFVCGGTLTDKINRMNPNGSINNNELTGKAIKNGTVHNLRRGDWLWIPPNTPHQHNSIKTARLLIVKIPC